VSTTKQRTSDRTAHHAPASAEGASEATRQTQEAEARESDGIESAARASAAATPKKGFTDHIEAFVSRLGSRNNFWHRVTSMIWLPYAFRSGIRMKRVDETRFTARLPFTRFNKNWYNAMAGAALLGNSEIAGGMYVFGICGGDYTVVCKQLSYRFLRPCFGPAEYRITPQEDIRELVNRGGEFNITIDMDIVQMIPTMVGKRVGKESRTLRRARRKAAGDGPGPSENPRDRAARIERLKRREKRVGRATATFHVTPKAHQRAREAARASAQ